MTLWHFPASTSINREIPRMTREELDDEIGHHVAICVGEAETTCNLDMLLVEWLRQEFGDTRADDFIDRMNVLAEERERHSPTCDKQKEFDPTYTCSADSSIDDLIAEFFDGGPDEN